MTEFPSSRLNVDAFYQPNISYRNTLPLRGGHFIREDLGAFDAGFFGITPTEAAAMDPAQRLVLETAYQAFENAGVPLEKASGSATSVHTGCFTDDYKLQLLKDPELLPKYAATGASLAMLANRLSWFFNLSGPSMNIDSACSSSGIALDHACQLLRNNDCDMSLVAGCNITFVSDYTALLTKMGFLSPDSRCHTFDRQANGYARGEGIAVVILQRVSDAVRDRNNIRAVIRSSGSNQDAHTSGITQPNSKAQERLIRETYRKAGLSMEPTRFVEAHGTGTQLGDDIETTAIGNAFRDYRSLEDPLYVGAVKTNIGHLEGASGLAGLIKAILVLETGVIAPNTNFKHINERIDAEYLRIKLPLTSIPWPTDGLRRISVNSFGFGGSNFHVVLDDAFHYLRDHNLYGIHCTVQKPPSLRFLQSENKLNVLKDRHDLSTQGDKPKKVSDAFRTPKLLVFSASDLEGLGRIATQMQEHLRGTLGRDIDHDAYLNDLAYTLDSRRSLLLWRSYAILESFSDIHSLSDRLSVPASVLASPPRLGFVFTGQGAQWSAMGRELYKYPAYHESVKSATAILRGLGCAWSPIGNKSTTVSHGYELTDTQMSSPSQRLIPGSMNRSIAKHCVLSFRSPLSISWIVLESLRLPLLVILQARSRLRQYCQASAWFPLTKLRYCAGAISRESAWKIAFYRGQMAALVPHRSSSSGRMLSVALSAEAFMPYLSKLGEAPTSFPIAISCINSNHNVTVSGPDHQVDLLKTMLDKDGIFARKLPVTVAYHSKQMEHIAEDYSGLIRDIAPNGSKRLAPMVSSVTGLPVDPSELRQSSYWVNNMLSPVLFLQAIRRLCLQDRGSLTKKIDRSHSHAIVVDHVLEIGPHAALQTPIRDLLQQVQRGGEIGYSSVLRRDKSAFDTFLNLAGFLHAVGVPVNLRRINDPFEKSINTRIALTDLPSYPFNHVTSYWHESRISSDYRLRDHGHVNLLGSPTPDWNPLDAQWRNIIRSDDAPWAKDHKISGDQICPGAAMIATAIEAITQLAVAGQDVIGYRFHDVKFGAALHLSPESGDTETKFALRSSNTLHSQDSPRYSFAIYSLKAKVWTEHCTGMIKLEYLTEVHGKHLRTSRHYADLWRSRKEICTFSVDSDTLYKFLEGRGIEYGPLFRRIKRLSCSSSGEVIGEVGLREGADIRSSRLHVNHPAVLDAVMHSIFAAQSKGTRVDIDTQVPTAIQDMWISRECLKAHTHDSILFTTSLDARTPLSVTSSSIALDANADHVLIVIGGLQMSTVARLPTASTTPGDSQVWSVMRTSIDIDLLSNDQVVRWFDNMHPGSQPESVEYFRDLRLYLKNVLYRTRAMLQQSNQVASQPHLYKYMEWMDWQLEVEDSSDFKQVSSQAFDELGERIAQEGPIGYLFSKIARNLNEILQERIDALHLLFEDNAVKRFYEASATSSEYFDKLRVFLAVTALKWPGMRILEVGAGTGIFTRTVLEGLSVRCEGCLQARMFDQYDFTDISPSFFENARTDFMEYGQKINYRVFDMEKDPTQQGLKQTSYDIIIAANVLHIASNMSDSLTSLRQLLRPQGKLILHETTTPLDITTGFIFGLLRDWWSSSHPARKMSPLLTEQDWDYVLKENGFSGTDIILHDSEEKICHQSSIMITTAVEESKGPRPTPALIIVIDMSSQYQRRLSKELRDRLNKNHESNTSIVSLEEISQQRSESAVFIFLLETENPFLVNVDSALFCSLQSCLRHMSQVLWVTKGGGQTPNDPGFGLVDGFARALRLEKNELKFVTLALDPTSYDSSHQLDHIIQVACQSFSPPIGSKLPENEYIEILGVLHFRRLSPASSLKTDMLERLHGRQVRTQRLHESKPIQVSITSPGQIDSVEIISNKDLTTAALGRDEIEVDVQAVGLASRDLIQALGMTEKVILGCECAGLVRRIPSDVPSKFRVGDRVCVLGIDLCQSYIRVQQDLVALIPEGLDLEQASVLPFRSWLASYLIHQVAQVSRNDNMLIHSGAGILGQLCIQLALAVEATVHATADSKANRCLLRERFRLPDDRIHFSETLEDLPGPLGLKNRFDVALDVSEDRNSTSLLRNVRPFGKLILVNGLSHRSRDSTVVAELRSNVTVSMIDCTSLPQVYLRHIHRPLQAIIDQTGNELAGLQMIELCNLPEVAGVLRQLKERDPGTRLVICMNDDDDIPVRIPLVWSISC